MRKEEAGDIFEMLSNSASDYCFFQGAAQERMFYSRISKEIKITFKWDFCQLHQTFLIKNRKAAPGNKCIIFLFWE